MSVISFFSNAVVSNKNFINKDLIWNIQGAEDKKAVTRFLKSFEEKLCVLACSTSQLYSNYTIEGTASHDRLMVLPAPACHLDTYNHVSEDAMVPTGFFAVPGSVIGQSDESLFLVWRKKGAEQFSFRPLLEGLQRLIDMSGSQQPFLPVICTRDLRYFRKKSPILQLNRLDISKLDYLSSLQIRDMENTIREKIVNDSCRAA
jgi:hypothetical protein